VGEMTVGGVLGESWETYKRFFRQFVLTAFIVYVVLDLLSALVSEASTDDTSTVLLWALVATVIEVVGYFWVQAALIELVHDVRDGRADRGIGETFQAVRPRLPSVIGAAILGGIGIAIGFVLLIVPGVYLLTIWSMIIPVIVIEGRGAMESFGRSREIVRGHGWSVLGLVIVTGLMIAFASLIIELVFRPLPSFLDTWIGGVVADSLTVPYAAAVLATAYFKLSEGRRLDQPLPPPVA